MRRRISLLIVLVLALVPALSLSAAGNLVLAQDVGESEAESDVGTEENTQQSEGGSTEGDEGDEAESGGQDEAEAETGAGEGESQDAVTESGPPWTYQMARMALAALLLLALAIGGAYFRFVVMRQRGAA